MLNQDDKAEIREIQQRLRTLQERADERESEQLDAAYEALDRVADEIM